MTVTDSQQTNPQYPQVHMDKISPISIVDRPIIIDNIWTRRSSSPTASSDNRTCRTAVTASKRWCYEVRVDAAVATLACRLWLLMVLFGTSSSSSGGSGSSYTSLQCFPFINVFVHLSGEMTRLWIEWKWRHKKYITTVRETDRQYGQTALNTIQTNKAIAIHSN